MIDLGLIDETRLALEKAIDKDIALEGVHGLGSLLAEQRAVLVFDNKITNQIKKIINLIGSDARVKCVGLPIPGLAYPSALPIKNINELDASIIKNSDLSDSKYFDLLRRARFVDIPDTASALYVFDSMRFAGVPCITEIQSERHGLPSAGAILIDSKMTFEHAVKTHSKDYEALSQNALKYVHSEHSLSAYISTLRQTLVAQSQEV
jgi:hypothetical protein